MLVLLLAHCFSRSQDTTPRTIPNPIGRTPIQRRSPKRIVHVMNKEVSGLVNGSPAFPEPTLRLTRHTPLLFHLGSTGEDHASFHLTPTLLLAVEYVSQRGNARQ
jgi:hypothetical protein